MKLLLLGIIIVSTFYTDECLGSRVSILDMEQYETANNVLVWLKVPYPAILKDEKPPIIFCVKNFGDGALNVAHDIGYFYSNITGFNQLWFEVADGEEKHITQNELGVQPWNTIYDYKESYVRKINPQESLVVGTRDITFSSLWRGVGKSNVRALLIVGDKLVATSNWQSVEVINKSVKDSADYVEIDYDGVAGIPSPLRVCEILGERWIFQINLRVAKVPESTNPRYEMNKGTGILKIHFDGTQYGPITHDVKNMRTISGPKELIPHVYLLNDLENIVSSARFGDDMSKLLRPVSNEPSKSNNSIDLLKNFLWIAILITAFVFLAFLFRHYKKRFFVVNA